MKRVLLLVWLICWAGSTVGCHDSAHVVGESREDNRGNGRFQTLDFLYQISGQQTVIGIHNREPNAEPDQMTEAIRQVTGRYPGLWSGDFLFRRDDIANRGVMVEEALGQWRRGAIINIMWHACNPALAQPCGWNDSGVKSQLTDEQWRELLTDGTPLNNRWKAMMDEVAAHLAYLQDHGVEVLWRPLHEMNQKAFWWGGRPGPKGTSRLYQITHDYMTNTKGLTNLIWVWSLQDFSTLAMDVETYNPGNEYWDIASLDIYEREWFGNPFTQTKYQIMRNMAGGKPIAIGECKQYPTAAQLASQPSWTFVMGWSELVFKHNTEQALTDLFHADRIITLDQMPGWNR